MPKFILMTIDHEKTSFATYTDCNEAIGQAQDAYHANCAGLIAVFDQTGKTIFNGRRGLRLWYEERRKPTPKGEGLLPTEGIRS